LKTLEGGKVVEWVSGSQIGEPMSIAEATAEFKKRANIRYVAYWYNLFYLYKNGRMKSLRRWKGDKEFVREFLDKN
jgi:hypothetical protein